MACEERGIRWFDRDEVQVGEVVVLLFGVITS